MVLLVLFFFCHVELEIPVHEISGDYIWRDMALENCWIRM